jgi:hypothetical protein
MRGNKNKRGGRELSSAHPYGGGARPRMVTGRSYKLNLRTRINTTTIMMRSGLAGRWAGVCVIAWFLAMSGGLVLGRWNVSWDGCSIGYSSGRFRLWRKACEGNIWYGGWARTMVRRQLSARPWIGNARGSQCLTWDLKAMHLSGCW